jgi:hypothetical protein
MDIWYFNRINPLIVKIQSELLMACYFGWQHQSVETPNYGLCELRESLGKLGLLVWPKRNEGEPIIKGWRAKRRIRRSGDRGRLRGMIWSVKIEITVYFRFQYIMYFFSWKKGHKFYTFIISENSEYSCCRKKGILQRRKCMFVHHLLCNCF